MRKVLLIISIMLLVMSTGCSYNGSVKSMEDRLEGYMQAVYAPKSMKEFRDAKADSLNYFEKSVSNRFFVAYSADLTEADLERICDTFTVHGYAENQSDGKERYLITAYLYNKKGALPTIKDFTFIIGDNGKVEDFTITDTNTGK